MNNPAASKPSQKRTMRSEETREKQRLKAVEHGRARAAEVEGRVKLAMQTIENEMVANNGIYPHKGGKVSEAEVYRRAGVHPTTVPKNPTVYGELDRAVKGWKANLGKEKKPTGREGVRQSLAERAQNYKARHDALLQVHQLVELELQSAETQLILAVDENKKLKSEIQRLREQLALHAASKIKPFPKKKDH